MATRSGALCKVRVAHSVLRSDPLASVLVEKPYPSAPGFEDMNGWSFIQSKEIYKPLPSSRPRGGNEVTVPILYG